MDEEIKFDLSVQEMTFAMEYFTTHNATQSYMKAFGSSYNVSNTEGHKLKRKPHIKAYIEYLAKETTNDLIMTAEEVLIELSAMAKGLDEELPKHQKIYSKDKVKALELMAKHHTLLTDVLKSEVEQRVVIVDDIMEVEGE